MTVAIPLVRHGHASVTDQRLLKTLELVRSTGLPHIESMLESLLDYDGQLWATWRSRAHRGAGSAALSRAWQDLGGERDAMHLIRSDSPYDYQSECMNDASD